MNAEEYQDLYKLLRGSKSAFTVLDARTLFIEKKTAQSLEKIQEARAAYEQSRSRMMKQPAAKQVDPKAADADRQIKRIERKQDKVKEILKAFDEMMPKLQKLVDREGTPKKAEAEVDPESKPIEVPRPSADSLASDLEHGTYERPANRNDLTELFIARFNQLEGDEQLLWIGKHFGFREIKGDEDVHPDSLYFIKIQDESFLVQTRSAEDLKDGIPLFSVACNIPMKTYTREAFVRLGQRRRMVLLTTEYEYSPALDNAGN
ncbi:MAG: hypothetical protein WBD20_10050 [Pirellulaceae bacterium]